MLFEPWPWYMSGPLIAAVMAILILMGKRLGMSSNLETLCTLTGAGRFLDYFKIDTASKRWNLIVIAGVAVGGFLGANFLSNSEGVDISTKTIAHLQALGFNSAGTSYLPTEFFSAEALSQPTVWVLLLVAGFLVGFGARYAGGCTSGHAISGLSNMQLPSLVAVLGFFAGGLIMVHLLFPLIFGT